jgi:hypothetical protein
MMGLLSTHMMGLLSTTSKHSYPYVRFDVPSLRPGLPSRTPTRADPVKRLVAIRNKTLDWIEHVGTLHQQAGAWDLTLLSRDGFSIPFIGARHESAVSPYDLIDGITSHPAGCGAPKP